ncbi:TATA box-binding protein-associated factor RNA polymerase I subunit C [Betta splendens]|uniref:TATA box-binding protein-associated factor RNA polymerase I subunit C n=1 Tax=Betta splendens TaxID=158456 RepID=A0A6P7P6N0_BETSP|nr:TATA box-binding protein-associated factor RNA polymerase I subunit C [Betta splendens]
MDYEFPQQLFPSFYNCGPPDSVLKHTAGKWGTYNRVKPVGGSGPVSSWTFASSHHTRGETWRHTEPVPIPLLSPKNHFVGYSTPPDPLDFTQHMQNFFEDHCHDAFGCMGEILGENFNFKSGRTLKYQKDSIHMWKVKNFLDMMKFKVCTRTYSSRPLEVYNSLLSDVVPSVPPELLSSLLHEELTEQRDRLLLSEASTGGALAFNSFSQTGSSLEHGCLIYPGNQGLDRLNFHKVVLQHQGGDSAFLDATSSPPLSHQLKGPIRQISSSSLFNECFTAVRSDRLCGVWSFSETKEPRLLQVVNTKDVVTCVNISPHVIGEVLVTSESGAANLWTIGKGMQKVREESSNLYFNAESPWRWCEFSAHPRVMAYADRTGAELTDIRVSPVSGHTLFRISNTSECRSGERLILAKYLGDVHPFHHLITTQYSAYIIDERFPCMPMLKWDHLMRSPPMFCHILPASSQSSTAKVLLGSHSSQEITLLQYSGGRHEPCFSQGPPQALLTPRNSLKHLPVQIPHRLDTASSRLSLPAAGLTCIQKKSGGKECLCVLQLTEAGDIFYQILTTEHTDNTSPSSAAEDEPLPTQAAKTTLQAPDSQVVASDAWSDDDAIGPSQAVTVAETPEKEQRSEAVSVDSFSEDSDAAERCRKPKQWLQVVINDDPEPDQVNGSEKNDVTPEGDKVGATKEPEVVEVAACGSRSHVGTNLQPSKQALVTWRSWLQKLMHKNSRPHHLPHFTVSTKGLLQLPNETRDPTEEQLVHQLKQDLRGCMSKRSLLSHGALSSLVTPDVVQVPNQVDTEVWRDQLSQRLTLSWQGEEAWRAWWEDQLGLNREKKVEALKRKRRREKEAKRASGQRMELSGSFTSSLSQSELDEFSDSTGWSSAASQGRHSDTEGTGLLSQRDGTPEATTPSTVQNDTPNPTPSSTPQTVKSQPGSERTPSSTQTGKHDSSAVNQRTRRRLADDRLSALFASQDEPLQNSYLPEQESTSYLPPPPVASPSSSSQLLSPQSASLRSLRVDLSKDSFGWSGFSQSLSQSSKGRPGPSQASQSSQPKKKKSRMGF